MWKQNVATKHICSLITTFCSLNFALYNFICLFEYLLFQRILGKNVFLPEYLPLVICEYLLSSAMHAVWPLACSCGMLAQRKHCDFNNHKNLGIAYSNLPLGFLCKANANFKHLCDHITFFFFKFYPCFFF